VNPYSSTSTLDPEDLPRIASLLRRVQDLMSDGAWRSLAQIRDACGGSETSVSARLRDLRRPEHGGFAVLRQRRPSGLYLYSLDLGPQRRLF
jgi:hypothetical protein